MRVIYDAKTDSLTNTLRDDEITESGELGSGVVADFGRDGKIVRFEILEASRVGQNMRDMQFAVGE